MGNVLEVSIEQKAIKKVRLAKENGIEILNTGMSTFHIKYHVGIDRFTFYNTMQGGCGEYWEEDELVEKLQSSDFAEHI